MKKTMAKSTTKITLIIVCLIVLVVGYFAYLSNRSREQKEEAAMSKVQSTLSRSLENDYPPTPKEVVKYYNEILRCFYNEECTDEEIDALGNKARELYDAELLENNELGTYLINLHADIADYRENERKISSISLASSTNVDFFSEDGFSFAKITCNYNIMEDGTNYPIELVYLLRRDENKQWRIYGWKAADELE